MSEPDSAALAVLQGELEQDLAALPSLVDENRRAAARIESGARDSLDYAAKVMIAQASVEPACEAFGKAVSGFIATLAAAGY